MNIKELREKLNLSQQALAERTGISRDKIGNWESGRGKPKAVDYTTLVNFFTESGAIDSKQGEETLTAGQKSIRKPKIDNEKNKGMPVYESAPATLSNTPSYRDEIQTEPDFWLNIPQYRNCNYATRAKGDSMHPAIRNMALVGGKEIVDFGVIVYGDIYIVHTKNGIETIKYIHPHPEHPEMVLLVPYNKSATTTPIHRSDIIRLFQAEFVLNPL